MALDIKKLPDWLLNDIRERGLSDAQIASMDARNAFREYCNWNGVFGYDGDFYNPVHALDMAEKRTA